MSQDNILIQQIKNGDKDALHTLYIRYKDFLLTLANALLHDSFLAEDVVHDVFVNFIRNITTFRDGSKLKAYLAVCAANQARSLLRSRKIQVKTTDFAIEPQAKETPCPVESQETAEQIRMSLAKLPDEQREVVVLHLKAGLKFRQIAQSQQTTISTVKGRYRYGMDKLRSLLNGELKK